MNIRWFALAAVSLALGMPQGAGFAQTKRQELAAAQTPPQLGMEIVEENASSLSGPQKLDRSQKRIGTMRGILEQASQMLERARKDEKDVLKVNCINEKLAPIKGFLKVSEQSYVSLTEAVTQSDNEASTHHYTLIAIANQKVQALGEESRVCVGEVVRFAESTQLDVNIDPDMSDDQPGFRDDDDLLVERLPEMTPWK